MKFENIKNYSELTDYLSDSVQRLKNIKHVCHYTKLSAITSILNSGYWYFSNPEKMNDLFEFKKFKDKSAWKRIFFASFMAEQGESVAMWSMYAQPWEEGVKVSIPIEAFKEWVESIKEVYPIVAKAKKGTPFPITEAPISIVRVAYADIDSSVMCIKCAEKENKTFGDPYCYPSLAGYIKDTAWDYEKEIRLRVDWPEDSSFENVAVKVPESVLSKIEICKGPRYSGKEILTSLPRKYRSSIDITTSNFSEKIGWIPCDDCKKIGNSVSLTTKSKDILADNRIIEHIYEKGHAIPSLEKSMSSEDSKELRILGFSAEGFLHTYRKELIQFLRSGKNIKILLSKPATLLTRQASEMESRPQDAIDQSIISAVGIIRAIRESAKTASSCCGEIETRFFDTEIRNQCIICLDNFGRSKAWLTMLMPPLAATNCPMAELTDGTDCENYFSTIWDRHDKDTIMAIFSSEK